MIIVTCHKCGKKIHKADKCPYCGDSTKFGTVNAVSYTHLAFRLAAGNTLRFFGVCVPLLVVLSLIIAVLLAGQKDLRRF